MGTTAGAASQRRLEGEARLQGPPGLAVEAVPPGHTDTGAGTLQLLEELMPPLEDAVAWTRHGWDAGQQGWSSGPLARASVNRLQPLRGGWDRR